MITQVFSVGHAAVNMRIESHILMPYNCSVLGAVGESTQVRHDTVCSPKYHVHLKTGSVLFLLL